MRHRRKEGEPDERQKKQSEAKHHRRKKKTNKNIAWPEANAHATYTTYYMAHTTTKGGQTTDVMNRRGGRQEKGKRKSLAQRAQAEDKWTDVPTNDQARQDRLSLTCDVHD